MPATVRDQFAMAALTGLMPTPGLGVKDLVAGAYEIADAMMDERERRQAKGSKD